MEQKVKDHAPRNSTLCLTEPHPYYEDEFAEASENAAVYRIAGGSRSEKSTEISKNLCISTSPSSLSSPSSSNSDGIGYQKALKYQPEESHSVVNLRGGYGHFPNTTAGGMSSLLAFDQNDYSVWEENSHSTSNGVPFGWLSPEANENSIITDNISSIQDLGRQERTCLISTTKRPYTEESTQEFKKQCMTSVTKTLKSKSTLTKDPQSIAAKNRRERISERLKILQSLVPNGSKVDLVTMLEKAISYVKFLQLQVKVLATDEFWPAQGAKAPDPSQVKEAIDAILASQRNRNSCSSK